MPKSIAFAVLAHQDPDMVRRLAEQLRGRPVVVHVDAKVDVEPFERIPGIHLVKDRLEVTWGGFSVVEATLRLYRDCLHELGDERDSAVVLLSGSDFPVRPIAEFEEHVASTTWTEHIRAVPVMGDRWLENRLRRRWYFDAMRPGLPGWRGRRNAVARRMLAMVLPRRRRAQFRSLTPAMSSQWTMLSRACLEDLLAVAHDPAYQRLFRTSFAPDELFFATLIHSGPWGARTEFGGLEARSNKQTSEFPNLHYIDPSLAVWLDARDAAKVVRSGAFFARKLRSRDLDQFLDAVVEERASLPMHIALRDAPGAGGPTGNDA